jgi:hypothetical protein
MSYRAKHQQRRIAASPSGALTCCYVCTPGTVSPVQISRVYSRGEINREVRVEDACVWKTLGNTIYIWWCISDERQIMPMISINAYYDHVVL